MRNREILVKCIDYDGFLTIKREVSEDRTFYSFEIGGCESKVYTDKNAMLESLFKILKALVK